MTVRIIVGDVREKLRELPSGSAHCCITSPPYWGLRSYIADGDPLKPFEIGLEASYHDYVDALVDVFREVRRVLNPDGTLWLNLGDCYASAGGAGWQGKNGQRADRRFTPPHLGVNRGRHTPHQSGKEAYRLNKTGFEQPNRAPQAGHHRACR